MRNIGNVGRVASTKSIESFFRSCHTGTVLTLSFQDSFTDLYEGKEVRGTWVKGDEGKYHFAGGTNFVELFDPEIDLDVYPDEMLRPFLNYPGCCSIYQGDALDGFNRAPTPGEYPFAPGFESFLKLQSNFS